LGEEPGGVILGRKIGAIGGKDKTVNRASVSDSKRKSIHS
jgi:hypothetical protein